VVRAVLRGVVVLQAALLGAVAAFWLDVGAKPCLDLIQVPAACIEPQPAGWGVALLSVAGALVALTGFGLADKRRR
jgi:hypothetical protein